MRWHSFQIGVALHVYLRTKHDLWSKTSDAVRLRPSVGFYTPAMLATVFAIGTLSLFRWIEAKLPPHYYAHHFVRFDRNNVMPEQELKDFLKSIDLTVANMSYRGSDNGLSFEYRMVIRTIDRDNLSKLSVTLRQRDP